MDEHKYTELLILQSAELTGGTPFCPEDQEMAEYFEGVLPQHERSRLERHLVDCRFCLARLGLLERMANCEAIPRIPGDTLAAAKAFRHGAPGRRHSLTPAWAAAAVLVVAVGLFWQADFTGPSRPLPSVSAASSGAPDSVRKTRSIDSAAMGPRFLSPSEGLAVIPADNLFRWTSVPDCRFYQLRIVTGSGDLLWQERVVDTEWELPAGLHLEPGAEYFVRVEAFLADTRALKSGYLPFRVDERR